LPAASSVKPPAALRAWIAAERRVTRRVDRRLLDPGSLEAVDPFYLPETGNVFELPSFWVDARKVEVDRASPAPSIERQLFRRGRALFLAHPLALPHYRRWLRGAETGPRYWATPSSSTRTVFAFGPGSAFFAKLTLPFAFAGERREVTRALAAESLAATRALRRRRGGLRILPETVSVIPREPGLGGFLVRELPRRPLTPWFALKNPRRHLARFLRAWMTSAIEHGWVADVHAQNILVGDGGYWVRDLDSVWLDDPELEGARSSLHSYFLGGPARGHRAEFLRALERYAGKAARDPDTFAQWLADQRHAQGKPPRPPASVRRWLKLEQTKNPRSRDPRRFAPISMAALPQRARPENQPVWRLPYFVAPLGRVKVYGKARPAELFTRRGVRVFFHPLMAERYALDVLEYGAGTQTFWATPTASPRSVVVWNERHLFALKLSLDVELLGLTRLVEDSKLTRAPLVSSLLRGVRVLREPVAVKTEEKAFGFIYRALPKDVGTLTPGFALKLSFRLLHDRIFPALVDAFAALALGQGLIGDLHQQNVLFTPKFQLVLRDLDSFKTDPELRKRRGLRTPKGLKLDARAYHRAWADELRAEWMHLAKRDVPRALHRRLWERLDALLLAAAERHLGKAIVAAERAHLARQGWKGLTHPSDPTEPLYSLEAMVKAWKAS
jgi:IucA / IucC family